MSNGLALATPLSMHETTGKPLTDVIAPGLKVLFCGINPGMYSNLTGHHFARPGNRFWPTLFASGFTDRLLKPSEERELLRYGLGITNIAARATTAASEVSDQELREGGQLLVAKVATFRPHVLAILGVSAYRVAFNQPKAKLGTQPERFGESILWVLPNPSGLNAHYTPTALAQVYREFRLAIEAV